MKIEDHGNYMYMCVCPGLRIFIVCISVNEQLYVCIRVPWYAFTHCVCVSVTEQLYVCVCVCALVQNRNYAAFGVKCRWSLCVIFKQCVVCHSLVLCHASQVIVCVYLLN